jgi:long-subunit fatty acid transport protein
MRQYLLPAALACTALGATTTAQAQPRTGWMMETNGFAAYQSEADLSGGGDVSSTRVFLSFAGLYQFDEGNAAGLSIGLGQQSYDFDGGAVPLWGDIRAVGLSAPLRFQLGQSANVIVSPQVRQAYERGASGSDSTTYGVFAGVSWQVSDALRIGPAFGAFSELEGSGAEVFPALIVDWQISDRWHFSTGGGVAATRGPGLRLGYAYSDALDIGLGVRLERSEFRLDQTGLAPGGVGEDNSIPVVISLDYKPNPGVSVNGFIGAALDGELKVEDATGATINKQSYDPAPVAGLAIRLRF